VACCLIGHFIARGLALGLKPNPLLDPAWYAARLGGNHDAEAGLRHFVLHGDREGRAASALFSGESYLALNPDVRRSGEPAPAHYLRCGRSEGRDYASVSPMSAPPLPDGGGQPAGRAAGQGGGAEAAFRGHYLEHAGDECSIWRLLFDPAFYMAQLGEDEAAETDLSGAFGHFVRRMAGGKPEMRTSAYFDPHWYRAKYPSMADGIGKDWLCALHHYMANGTPTEFDPLPGFSEAAYLERYPDVAAAVGAGSHRNGYEHFLTSGVFELRSPASGINLKNYVSSHASVRDDLEAGRSRDAFAHLLQIGSGQGLAVEAMGECPAEERGAKLLFRARAENMALLAARQPFDFTLEGPPALSVIMVLHNQLALSLMAIGSLRQNHPGPIELILADSGSDDGTRHIGRFVRGATILRFESNIGFVLACNAALVSARGPCVLLLNNDVELAPGAVAAALRRLGSDPLAGAVGGKVIRTHGKLQEAGCIVWRDGATQGYMRDASPLAPEANFVRDVDHCSGAFLLVRAGLLERLGGFEAEYAPAYYEDTDLCMRITQAGFRVVYDPSVVVYHHEYGSAASFRDVEVQSARSRAVFVRRHADALRARHIADRNVEVFARSAQSGQRRLLFIDDRIPLRVLGSGFVRSNDLIGIMAELGFHVTVFPVNEARSDMAGIYADMPETAEVMHDRSLDSLAEFLASREGYYDTVWVARTHNLDLAAGMLERHCTGKAKPPRIVLDSEAIAAEREAVRVAVSGCAAADTDAAVLHEFRNAALCQRIVATSQREADILGRLGFADVAVIGHMLGVRPTARPFADRSGILFVGAVHDMGSPNYDSLCWFVDEVLPLVEESLGWETRLTVVGHVSGDATLERFRGHCRLTLRGEVADTEPLYNAHRVFVAPTRFAAGLPYKVYEAASSGLPVVATELLRRQTGWENGREMLSADASDPALFARQILSVYRDAGLWQHLRDHAAARLLAENGRDAYVKALRGVLGGARD